MSRFKNITEIDREKLIRPAAPVRDSADPEETAHPEFLHPPMLAGEALETLIGIRDAIWKLSRERPLRLIGITSSGEMEGKTRMAVGLSLTFAMDTRKRVLLVDANLRAPAVSSLFRLPSSPGLSDLILEDLPLNDVLLTAGHYPLSILVAGKSHLTPAEIYSFPRFAQRMAEIRESFDMTIVDTSGVKRHPDVEIFGKHLDGVVLVMEADRTQLSLMQATKTRIEAAGVPILGVVMNRVKNPIPHFINRRFGLD